MMPLLLLFKSADCSIVESQHRSSEEPRNMCNKVQKGAGFNPVKPDTKQSKRSPHQRLNISQALLVVLSFYLASLPTSLTAQVESLVASNTDFALNLYARLAAKSGDSNIFLSP